MSRHKKYSCPLGPKQVPQCPTCHRRLVLYLRLLPAKMLTGPSFRFSRADSLTRHLDNPAQCGKNVARRQRQDPSTMRLQSPQIDSTPSSGCPAPSLASDNSSSKPFLGFASAPSAGSSSSNGDSYQNDLFYSSDSPQDDYTLFYPDN